MFAKATSHVAGWAIEMRTLVPVLGAAGASWVLLAIFPMRHDVVGFVVGWSVMALAMMVPTVLRPMQRIAQGSHRRALEFVVGYLAIWTVAALPAWLVVTLMPRNAMMLALTWIGVGLYLQMPFVIRSFHSCKKLPSSGRATDLGIRQGISCLIGCAPLMTVAMLSVMVIGIDSLASAGVMFGLMLVMIWQKNPRTSDVALRSVGAALVIGSALLGASGVLSAPDTSLHVH